MLILASKIQPTNFFLVRHNPRLDIVKEFAILIGANPMPKSEKLQNWKNLILSQDIGVVVGSLRHAAILAGNNSDSIPIHPRILAKFSLTATNYRHYREGWVLFVVFYLF